MALAPAVAHAERPSVATGAPTEVTSTSATFNGTVTPNGNSTSYSFVYGTTRYSAHTSPASAGNGTAPFAVSAHVDGLSAATTYHVRLVAFNRDGLGFGDDVVFATLTSALPTPVAPTPPPPPPQLTPGSALSGAAAPPPVLGESVNLDERSGAVTVKVPGSNDYVALSKLSSVPVGSLVDTRGGTVTLRTALPGGQTQSGIFHGGLFEVRQPKDAKGLTELKLRGAGPDCGKGSARAASVDKKKKKRKKRKALWGRDNGGAFRTRGGNSVATVRGTAWYTEDRCDGTLTRVSQGSVTVRDLVNHRTVIVRAGHSYLAPKHP
jgi:hypothetical protein